MAHYFKYVKKFKNKIKIYISKQRLFDFLGFEPYEADSVNSEDDSCGEPAWKWQLKVMEDISEFRFKRIIRILAYYFLEELAVPSILCSKKMKQELKFNHLLLRR